MSVVEDNIKVVRAFVDAVNTRDYDRFTQVFASDATIAFSGATMPCDPEAARELAAQWVAVFPDWHLELADLIAADDKVLARVPWTGTQHGPLPDMPATGRAVHVDEMVLFRLANGLVAEAWEVWDEATMMRQLAQR